MKVNGEERSLPQDGTVLGLLRELDTTRSALPLKKRQHRTAGGLRGGKLTDADHLEVGVLRGRRRCTASKSPFFRARNRR